MGCVTWLAFASPASLLCCIDRSVLHRTSKVLFWEQHSILKPAFCFHARSWRWALVFFPGRACFLCFGLYYYMDGGVPAGVLETVKLLTTRKSQTGEGLPGR